MLTLEFRERFCLVLVLFCGPGNEACRAHELLSLKISAPDRLSN